MISRLKTWAIVLTALIVSNTATAQQWAPECDPCCNQGGNFRGEVDFLWWQLRDPGGYTTETTVTTEGIETDTVTELVSRHVNFHPGFRLGFFYKDDCLCPSWDLGIIWTHFNVHHSESRDAAVGRIFNIGDGAFAFDGSFKSNLNYVDVDVSKQICVNDCFTFTPHIGIRTLWIDSHTTVSGDAIATDVTATVSGRTHFDDRAIGIEGGFWAEWKLGCGLSLEGHVGGSILQYKNNFSTEVEVVTSTGETILADTTTEFKGTRYTGSPTFDYYIGAKYTMDLCGYNVAIKAGWENFFINFQDYHFHGLTTGVQVNF